MVDKISSSGSNGSNGSSGSSGSSSACGVVALPLQNSLLLAARLYWSVTGVSCPRNWIELCVP